MKKLVCIMCPKGCRLSVNEENDYAVTGNACARGVGYGKKEITNPTRVITSTVKIAGALYSRCPVKTDRDIPKSLVIKAMPLLNNIELRAPVKTGDIVVPIFDTGANFVVTRDMDAV